MPILSLVYEKMKLFSKLIFINKKYALISFIGLGISLSLIAQSLLFLFSFQYNAFNTYVSENPEEQITIMPSNMLTTLDREDTIVPDLEASIDQALLENDLEERVEFRGWFNRRAVVIPYENLISNNTELLLTSFVGIPMEDYFSIIEPFIIGNGSLPTNSTEVLFFIRSDRLTTTNISTGLQNVYVHIGLADPWAGVGGIPGTGAALNVTGLVDVYAMQTALNDSSFESSLINNFFSVIEQDEMLVSSHRSVMDFTHGLIGSLLAPDRSAFIGSVLFNLQQIDAFDLDTEISRFIAFTENLRVDLLLTDFIDNIHMYLDLVVILQDFALEFRIFTLFTLLFMIPIIIMALSLSAYSAKLVRKRRKIQLHLLNQRGSSQTETVIMLLIELLIFTSIAIGIAFLLAYPFAFLILKSNGFLDFSGPMIIPRFFPLIVAIVLITGFVGSLLVNIGSIWNLSQLDQEEAYSELAEKKPFWERFYVDVFFFVVGIAFWIITFIQLRNAEVSVVFARLLGVPAPLLTIIGAIMLVSRFFPLITKWLSKATWKTNKLAFLSLPFRSLSRRRSASIRSLVLVMFIFTMTTTSIFIPDSYQGFDYENAQYTLGADIVISPVSLTDKAFRQNIEAIEGVEATTYVAWFSPTPASMGSLTYAYTFMGINTSEFAQVGYYEKEYIKGDFEEMIALLDAPLDVNVSANVLVQKDQISSFGLSQGETFTVYIPYWVGHQELLANRTIKAVEFYDYWPVIYQTEASQVATNFRLSIITTMDHIANLTIFESDIYGQLFIKVAKGHAISSVVKEMQQYSYGRRLESINDLITISEDSLRATVLYGALNSNFLSSVIILFFAIITLLLIQALERVNEMGIQKTIGASPLQLFGLFFTESFTTLIIGAIIGIFLSMFTSYMFMSVIAVNRFIPPWEMVYSPAKLFLALSIVIGASLLSAIIPSVHYTKRSGAIMIKDI